jgi:hypothetical protein
MRSFEDVWKELQYKAETCRRHRTIIYTLDKRSGNRIVEVASHYIRRDSETKRTGSADKIYKSKLKSVWDKLAESGQVRASQINALYFTYALLARLLDDVTYELRPLRLILRGDTRSHQRFEPIRKKLRRLYKPRRGLARGGGESREHKDLKNRIAGDPFRTLGEKLTLLEEGIEYPFVTGDRLDLLFQDEQKRFVCVEVEPRVGKRDVIGFHQAGKYRMLIAMAEDLDVSDVRAIVAAATIDRGIARRFMRRYGIESRVVR